MLIWVMVVVSITLPEDLLRGLDEFVRVHGYFSRSEAIRDAVRNLITEVELAKMGAENVAANIMVTYEYARKDVDRKLGEMRHEFDDVLVENIHRHIGEKYCLEILIAQGNVKRVMSLIGRVRGLRGIQQVKAIITEL